MENVKARLGGVMQLGVPSDKLTEIYGYFESAPYPRIWTRGNTISSKNFRSIQFNVTNRDWGRRIMWHVNDRQDDQTKTLFDQARAAGEHWATLPERIFFQVLRNVADADLLPAIPLSADGAAWHATTAAGADRFGVTGGNIETGTGIATPVTVRTDFFNAIERFRQFQDTEGQPLWDESLLDQGFTVIYNVANDQTFREAFIQGRTIAAATTATSNAAVTNIIMESGLNVKLWATQRLTDNDWYIFASGAQRKSFFQQQRQPLEEAFATWETSDWTRDTGEEYIQWKSREGYGLVIPYDTVKVDN